MSVLTLVRHGQASFGSDNYDRLSTLGEEQARQLGRYLASNRVTFDEVYTGPRSRQQRTSELVAIEFEAAGLSWPSHVILKDLDEYDLDGLFHRFAPTLMERFPQFALLMDDYEKSEGAQNRLRTFQRMFESLLRHWQLATTLDSGIESWPGFQTRVQRVISHVQNQTGRSRRAIMFTSGGLISGVTQQALGISDEMTLELNWRLRNSSMTEFVFTTNRFTLDNFNSLPHLDDSTMWTYR